jgi:hypothetical protein
MRILPILAAIGVALAPIAADAAPAAHKAAAKPAAAAAAPGAPAAAAPIPGFDARDPDSIIALLKQMKAEGKVVRTDKDSVVVAVSAQAVAFGVQMIGCDAKGKACHALILSASSDAKGPTLAQINLFNRAQPMCRGLLNAENKVTVMYFTLVNPRMTVDETRQHMAVWGGCLQNFSAFLKNPDLTPPKPAG